MAGVALLACSVPAPSGETTSASAKSSSGNQPLGTLPEHHQVIRASLGGISLQQMSNDVLARLGEPLTRTVTHGAGSPQWVYANGMTVDLDGPPGPGVWKLYVREPFQGSTGDGFRIGDGADRFRAVYGRFDVRAFPGSQPDLAATLTAVDGQGTKVSAYFNAAGVAVSLVITDMRCASCNKAPTQQG